MSTLAEAFAAELARNNKTLAHYELIGPPGRFGAARISALIERATAAQLAGDVMLMMVLLEDLKDTK
jgi:hypothetical protein